MHCTQCGVEGTGRFCPACGASFLEIPCPQCTRPLPKGSRFCTDCGSPVQQRTAAASGPTPPGSQAPVAWAVAGILLVGLLAVAAIPIFTGRDSSLPPGAGARPAQGALGPAANVDLSTMTPRQAADRLYRRIAEALSAEDTAQVLAFLPMAMDAYEMAQPLDTDGLFHLALLQRVALDYPASLNSALAGLEMDPDHLLHLSAAAEALAELGRREEARAYYQRLVDLWEKESVRSLPDYQEHAPLLPLIREEAENYLAQP